MNKRHYEHTLPNIRGSLSNTYHTISGNETNAAYKPLQHLAGQGCPNGRLFWYPILYEDKDDGIRDGKERKERHIQPLADRELQGKVGKRFFSDGKAGTLRVSRKNHPRPEGLRYFSRKPCLSGSVCRKAHVVQRTAKARVSTIKMIKS